LPRQFLEVDNLAQKDETIFVSEGKTKRENAAIKQLQDRYTSLKLFRLKYINVALSKIINLLDYFIIA